MTITTLVHAKSKKFQKAEEGNGNPTFTVRTLLKLSQERFARLLDVSNRTVARWEKGGGHQDPYMQKRLFRLEQVVRKIARNGEPREIVNWLEKPDVDLKGHSPLDLLGSAYATEELLDQIDEWGYGAS